MIGRRRFDRCHFHRLPGDLGKWRLGHERTIRHRQRPTLLQDHHSRDKGHLKGARGEAGRIGSFDSQEMPGTRYSEPGYRDEVHANRERPEHTTLTRSYTLVGRSDLSFLPEE